MAFANVTIHGTVDQDNTFTHNDPNDLYAVELDNITNVDQCPAV